MCVYNNVNSLSVFYYKFQRSIQIFELKNKYKSCGHFLGPTSLIALNLFHCFAKSTYFPNTMIVSTQVTFISVRKNKSVICGTFPNMPIGPSLKEHESLANNMCCIN